VGPLVSLDPESEALFNEGAGHLSHSRTILDPAATAFLVTILYFGVGLLPLVSLDPPPPPVHELTGALIKNKMDPSVNAPRLFMMIFSISKTVQVR
jgi:hypothetical protein